MQLRNPTRPGRSPPVPLARLARGDHTYAAKFSQGCVQRAPHPKSKPNNYSGHVAGLSEASDLVNNKENSEPSARGLLEGPCMHVKASRRSVAIFLWCKPSLRSCWRNRHWWMMILHCPHHRMKHATQHVLASASHVRERPASSMLHTIACAWCGTWLLAQRLRGSAKMTMRDEVHMLQSASKFVLLAIKIHTHTYTHDR